MDLNDILTILLPSLVTVIGFIVTSVLNRKNFIQSIQKYKTEQQISAFLGLQEDTFECLNVLCMTFADPNNVSAYNKLSEQLHSKVICFGSEAAVKIVSYMKSIVYNCKDDNKTIPPYYLIAAYVLLIMQIKYDTTGIKTSPKAWYAGAYTTKKMHEENFYKNSLNAINEIVTNLNLDDFLKVKLNDV